MIHSWQHTCAYSHQKCLVYDQSQRKLSSARGATCLTGVGAFARAAATVGHQKGDDGKCIAMSHVRIGAGFTSGG